jgi:hypothetical protein
MGVELSHQTLSSSLRMIQQHEPAVSCVAWSAPRYAGQDKL